MDILGQARKILKDTSIPWLELDIDFDTELWKQQAATVDCYTEYRETDSRGWSSCCLHGLGVDKIYTADNYGLNEYHAPYAYTDLAYQVPAITDFWRFQFPAERYTRIRFMKLAPGGFINWHDDGALPEGIDPLQSILPINLAVIHPKHCYMQIQGHGNVPWAEGKVIMVNISKTHAVFNNDSVDRVHMIGNVILGNRTEEFCKLLVRSYNKQYGQI